MITSQDRTPASAHAGRAPRAFTLVELLVVIGIIALLISILLPALSRAQEQSKRVKCAANLHNWGVAALAFAAEHKGMLPRAYRNKWTATGYPVHINGNDKDYPAGPWKKLGTPWSVFKSYGLTDQVAVCPSSEVQEVGYSAADSDGNWAPLVRIGYMYMGQIDRETFGNSFHNWKQKPPVRVGDKRAPLAADVVFRGGGAENGYILAGGIHPDSVEINHIMSYNPFMPDAQNVLYSDGSVIRLGPGDYLPASNGKLEVSSTPYGGNGDSGNDWSFLHFHNGGLFYWEGSK